MSGALPSSGVRNSADPPGQDDHQRRAQIEDHAAGKQGAELQTVKIGGHHQGDVGGERARRIGQGFRHGGGIACHHQGDQGVADRPARGQDNTADQAAPGTRHQNKEQFLRRGGAQGVGRGEVAARYCGKGIGEEEDHGGRDEDGQEQPGRENAVSRALAGPLPHQGHQ
ncbi:hypothetical protein DESC_720119 [Desulfosarcina cetonica]|nr:hypothetical protein DESC_720119 [Desulfosarcina cetonica]